MRHPRYIEVFTLVKPSTGEVWLTVTGLCLLVCYKDDGWIFSYGEEVEYFEQNVSSGLQCVMH